MAFCLCPGRCSDSTSTMVFCLLSGKTLLGVVVWLGKGRGRPGASRAVLLPDQLLCHYSGSWWDLWVRSKSTSLKCWQTSVLKWWAGFTFPDWNHLGLLSVSSSFVWDAVFWFFCSFFFLSDLVMFGRQDLNFLFCWICLLKLPENVRFQETGSMKRPLLRAHLICNNAAANVKWGGQNWQIKSSQYCRTRSL